MSDGKEMRSQVLPKAFRLDCRIATNQAVSSKPSERRLRKPADCAKCAATKQRNKPNARSLVGYASAAKLQKLNAKFGRKQHENVPVNTRAPSTYMHKRPSDRIFVKFCAESNVHFTFDQPATRTSSQRACHHCLLCHLVLYNTLLHFLLYIIINICSNIVHTVPYTILNIHSSKNH